MDKCYVSFVNSHTSDECAFCDNAFQFFFDGECILCWFYLKVMLCLDCDSCASKSLREKECVCVCVCVCVFACCVYVCAVLD